MNLCKEDLEAEEDDDVDHDVVDVVHLHGHWERPDHHHHQEDEGG